MNTLDTAARPDQPSAFNPASADDPDRTRWIAHLDEAVAEIFETMLGQRSSVVDAPPPGAHTSAKISAHICAHICATIVFSGALNGLCIVQASPATADRLTDALLGAEGDWDDEMIDDALGEMCNMIAGGWKSRLGALTASCQISVPEISRQRAAHASGHATIATRFYAFDGSVLEVTLALN